MLNMIRSRFTRYAQIIFYLKRFNLFIYKNYNYDLRKYNDEDLFNHYIYTSERERRISKPLHVVQLIKYIKKYRNDFLREVAYPGTEYMILPPFKVFLNLVFSRNILPIVRVDEKHMQNFTGNLEIENDSLASELHEDQFVNISQMVEELISLLEKDSKKFHQLFIDFGTSPFKTLFNLSNKLYKINFGLLTYTKLIHAFYTQKSYGNFRNLLRNFFANTLNRPDLMEFLKYSHQFDLLNDFEYSSPNTAIFKDQYFESMIQMPDTVCRCKKVTHETDFEKEGISFILSVYNGQDYLTQFFENITSINHFSDCELIIIDANSCDGTSKICEAYARNYVNIRYFKTNETVGIYEAWNLGIQESKYEYVCNANVDDSKQKDIVCTFRESFLGGSEPTVFYSDFYEIFDNQTHLIVTPFANKYNIFLFNWPHASPIWSKKLHDSNGYFNTKYRSISDWEFWIKTIQTSTRFIKLNRVVYSYYNNPDGISTTMFGKGLYEQWTLYDSFYDQILIILDDLDKSLKGRYGSIEF